MRFSFRDVGNKKVILEVLTAVNTKMAVVWVVAMSPDNGGETLVNFYQTTRRYNPEDSHLQKVTGL
jgi:hypothetical protein